MARWGTFFGWRAKASCGKMVVETKVRPRDRHLLPIFQGSGDRCIRVIRVSRATAWVTPSLEKPVTPASPRWPPPPAAARVVIWRCRPKQRMPKRERKAE